MPRRKVTPEEAARVVGEAMDNATVNVSPVESLMTGLPATPVIQTPEAKALEEAINAITNSLEAKLSEAVKLQATLQRYGLGELIHQERFTQHLNKLFPRNIEAEILASAPKAPRTQRTRKAGGKRVDAAALEVMRKAGKPVSAEEILKTLEGMFPTDKITQALKNRSNGNRAWFKHEAGKYSPVK